MSRAALLAALTAGLVLVGVGLFLLFSGGGLREAVAPAGAEAAGVAEDEAELVIPDAPAPLPSAPAATPTRREAAVDEPRRRQVIEDLYLPFRLEDDRGEPIARAILTFKPAETEEDHEVELVTEAGDLRLPLPAAGRWDVEVEVDGHTPEVARTSEPYFVPHEGPPILLRFLRNGWIRGRVVDEDGQGVPRIQVEVHLRGANVRAGRHGRISADATGSFFFESVPPVVVVVKASNDLASELVEIELQPGTEAEVEIRLPGSSYVRGVVFDVEGDPMPGAPVLLSADTQLSGMASDKDGGFFFGPLAPGTYEVFSLLTDDDGELLEGVPSAEVQLEAGMTVDVELRPETAASVKLVGRILHRGEALAKCAIYVFREDAGMLESVRVGRSDASGRYELVLAGPGPHVLYFEPHDDPRGDPSSPQRLVVEHEGTLELDLHLPSGEIRGRVLRADGSGANDAKVTARREDGYLDLPLPFDEDIDTAKDGSFQIPYLSDGDYSVQAFDQGVWPLLTGVRVTGGLPTEVELKEATAGWIVGTVTTESAQPVADAWIFPRDAGGRLLWDFRCQTSNDGSFSLLTPTGRVTLCARSDGLASFESGPLEVRAEKAAEVELRMVPAFHLTVEARDADGRPVAGSIRVFDADGHDVSRPTVFVEGRLRASISTFRRTVGPLPPGRYEVVGESLDGLRARTRLTLGTDDLEVELHYRR